MPNKITTQQLFDQYIAMNEKLESMEQKLDSVIKDDSLNTRLTGSNVEDDNPIPTYQKRRFRIDTKDPIPFSEFAEGSAKILRYFDLDPSAQKRYIIINSTLDVLIGSPSYYVPYFRQFTDAYLVGEQVELNLPN